MIILSHFMKTIKLEQFINDFMVISNKLTNTELRMLFLLIAKPEITNLSQQDFANEIHTDRRTINIGLKKLRKYRYVSDIRVKQKHFDDHTENNSNKQLDQRTINVSDIEIKHAKEFIIDSYIDYYHPTNNTIIINEDFYSFVLREKRLNKNLKYKKEFITKTIAESYPMSIFYFKLNKSFYNSEEHYHIVHRINNEISRARELSGYHIKKDKLMEYLFENYSINEEEVLQVINVDFPNFIIVGNRIKIPKRPELFEKNFQLYQQNH